MIHAMATQRACALEGAGGNILHHPERTIGHIHGVEVDQVRRVGRAMRIVTGGAGGFVVHDVAFMKTKT